MLWILCLCVPTQANAIYKCLSDNNKVFYSEQKCQHVIAIIHVEKTQSDTSRVNSENAKKARTTQRSSTKVAPTKEYQHSISSLINLFGQYPEYILAYFGLPVLLAWLLGLWIKPPRGAIAPWKYIYSTMVYVVCLPAMLAITIVVYTLFFTRQNLLEVNFLVYFMPIISMILTLMFIRRKVSFAVLPGFERLSGLMVLMALTFFIILFLYKTRIFIGFFGSTEVLIGLGIGVFVLLKKAASKLTK